jgi:hypothetical protein
MNDSKGARAGIAIDGSERQLWVETGPSTLALEHEASILSRPRGAGIKRQISSTRGQGVAALIIQNSIPTNLQNDSRY